MPDREETAPIRSIHGHTGPTTPSEDAARESPSASADEKIRIAEAASREEDA